MMTCDVNVIGRRPLKPIQPVQSVNRERQTAALLMPQVDRHFALLLRLIPP